MFAFLKQSTASQPRIVGPFVSDTDFKTLQTGLTIANTDVKLSKNGATSVNKNSGGGTHIINGNYALTFDATDTNTVGELHVSVKVATALVVVAKFWVLEEAIYDALYGASADGFDANQRVNVGRWLGTAVTTSATSAKPEVDTFSISNDATAANNAESFFDGTGYAGTNNVIPTVTTLTGHTAQTGDSFARLGAPAGASVSADIATVDTNVDTLLTRITSSLFSGITSLAEWLGALAGKQAPNATAQTEIRATGAGSGTFDATTDSVEAIRDTAPLGTAMRGTDSALLAASAPANFGDLAITASTGRVDVNANNDKTGYSISGTKTTLDALNDISAADVNAQVVDVIDTDTTTLPGQAAPSNTPTLRTMIAWLYKAFRNKKTQTATQWSLFDDAGSTVDSKATLDDTAGTTTKEEVVSGP